MARRPCFFKILISDFHTQLRIPHAFVKNLETNLPKKLPQEFIIETTGRRFWHVDLEKEDNCLYFRKGWKEFVQQNSLQDGDFLVFRYHDNFKFKLEIYGRNCCRKGVVLDAWNQGRQPLSCSQHEQETFEAMGGCRQNVQTKILRELNSVKKRKRSEGFSVLNDSAKGKTCEVDLAEMSDGASDDEDDQESLPDQRDQKKSSGLDSAREFHSNYPFFRVKIKPSYLNKGYLNVPKRFIRANRLELSKLTNIKLQVSSKTWSVNMSNHPYYARLCSGWSDFVRDNSLQEEYVCLFELIDNVDITFRVNIFGINS